MASDKYLSLSRNRDFAAYRALGCISAALCFCRQNRSDDAQAVLERALSIYEEADQALKSHFKPQGESHAVHASN